MSDYTNIPGMKADATLTQYRACRITGEHQVGVISNANAQRPIGIVQNDPLVNEGADIAALGKCRAEYGGTVTAGDKLACNDSGQLITDAEVLDGSAVDLHHIAIALEDGASGEVHYIYAISPQMIGKE